MSRPNMRSFMRGPLRDVTFYVIEFHVANREAVALRKQLDPLCGLGIPRLNAGINPRLARGFLRLVKYRLAATGAQLSAAMPEIHRCTVRARLDGNDGYHAKQCGSHGDCRAERRTYPQVCSQPHRSITLSSREAKPRPSGGWPRQHLPGTELPAAGAAEASLPSLAPVLAPRRGQDRL